MSETMKRFKVTAPDGKSYYVTAPENASQEDIFEFAATQTPDAGQNNSEPTITNRGIIAPIADYSDGTTGLAVPGLIYEPYAAFRRMQETVSGKDPSAILGDEETMRDLAEESLVASAPAMPLTVIPRTVPRPMAGRAGATAQDPSLVVSRAQRAVDAQAAARELDVDLPGFVHSTAPTQSVAKQLSETPFIGQPVRNQLERTTAQTARALERTADDLAPVREYDQTGATIQRGLNRFREQKFEDLEPSIVRDMGVDPRSPVPVHRDLSQGASRELDNARALAPQIGADVAETTRGAQVSTFGGRDQIRTARTGLADISDEQLSRVIRAPADQTSSRVRSSALYERAERMIPRMMRSDGSANPSPVATVNLRSVVQSIDRDLSSSAGGAQRLGGDLIERVRSPQGGNFNIEELFRIRRRVGEQLGNSNPLQNTVERQHLKGLYAAVSRDIENGLETLAARAINRTQVDGITVRNANAPNRVTPEEARQAAGALRAFKTADRYFRQSQARIDNFLKVVSADNPTMAAKRVVKAALANDKGNYTLFRDAMSVLRPAERAEIASLVLREMGTPRPSARGIVQEVGFSPESFITKWQNMDPRARRALFGEGHGNAINRSVDALVKISNELANIRSLENVSRSGTNTLNVTGAVGAITSAASGNFVLPAFIGGGGFALGYLMSRPAYARWTAQYLKLKANAVRRARHVAPDLRGKPNAIQTGIRNHVAQLERLAANDNTLKGILQSVAEEEGIDLNEQVFGPDVI